MAEHFPLMTATPGEQGPDLEVYAPYDRSLIATVATVARSTALAAMTTAHALFSDRDRWLTPAQRIAVLERLAVLMQEQADELALEAAREGGKPLPDSQVEVARAIDGVKNCIEVARNNAGEAIPMGITASSAQRMAVTRREPIGVVLAFSAFNHPLNLVVHQVGPAVAAGCPVLIKPAGDTPLSCLRFVTLLREAGLADGWCQAIVPENLDIASELAADPRVGFFSFIGSAKVGWLLRSHLAPGARAALEHGGAAPVVVAADADLDDVLPLLAKGGFYHAGQVCVSVQRVFAHRSVARQVAERLAELGNAMRVGDPTLADTEVGPLIREREVERVHQWVTKAIEAGAERISGGEPLSSTCYPPSVLLDPPDNVEVSCREIFGPVIVVYGYDHLDEAIVRANAVPFAFQAAVCTRELDTALRCYDRLNASAVMVNDHTAFRVDWMPFAGLRESGLGVGGIPYTFHDMQIEKMLVLRSRQL